MLPFSLLLALSAALSASAAVLPTTQKGTAGWCRPRFSGLVQEIRKTGEEDVLWRAVPTHPAGEGGVAAMDGVRAARLPRSYSAGLEEGVGMSMEWFVENTGAGGVYSITSGAATSTCLASQAPSDSQAQHAFSPNASPAASSTCAPSHAFRLLCQSCNTHDDAASSCFLQSLSKGLCVELLPPSKSEEGEERERPRLEWGECEWEGKEGGSWVGRGKRDARRQRQLWDISPS